MSSRATICPKCGKPGYKPYQMKVVKKYGQVFWYDVYRHPDGRRRTPRKHTVRILDQARIEKLQERKIASPRPL